MHEDLNKYNEILVEGRFIDGAILLVLAARLFKPFTKWPAYTMGIIDKKGNKLRDPETSKEKDAWSILNRLLAKIKKMFTKHKLIGSLLTYFVLLKENVVTTDDSKELMLENYQRENKVKDLELRIRNEILKEGLTEDEYYTLLTNINVKRIIDEGKRK